MPYSNPFPFLEPRVPPQGAGWRLAGIVLQGVNPHLKRIVAMTYTLGEAAKATGKSKPTIQRAIQKNVISATRNANGSYTIDPAELHRVFPALSDLKPPEPLPDPTELQRQIGDLRERLADKEGTIQDLRQRLDQEGEDRRKAHAQINALLTDQRTRAEKEATPLPRGSGWWVVGGLAVAIVAAVAWWVLNHPRIPS